MAARAAGHSGGRIQITARYQPIRGQGAGARAPRFPRPASLRGEHSGRRGARSRGEAEVLGILGGTGSTKHGRLHACQRPWGSQLYPDYPDSRPQGMWGVMICPSDTGVPGAPATGGSPWEVVGSDVGVFCAASLAGE